MYLKYIWYISTMYQMLDQQETSVDDQAWYSSYRFLYKWISCMGYLSFQLSFEHHVSHMMGTNSSLIKKNEQDQYKAVEHSVEY